MLTPKETTLLNDLISHEKLCIEKYHKSSAEACDTQLKGLFTQLEQVERQHLDTLNQILAGKVPTVGANSQSGGQGPQGGQGGQQNSPSSQNAKSDRERCPERDAFLCQDLLSTEKHISSMYNTCIFEFKDPQIRNVLNHIQKEEQQHGEKVYNYLQQHGMYS